MERVFELLINKATLIIILLGWALLQINAQPDVKIEIEVSHPGKKISEDFTGLSFETERLLPDSRGCYYFSPANATLIKVFKTLGIKSLRIGGNTADRPWYDVPDETDIDTFFAFVKKLDNVKVIYTLRLREGDLERATQPAKYIIDNYSEFMDCFAIGNEPNVFAKEYDVYKDEWKKYSEAVLAAVPDAKFCGPSSTPGKTEWALQFTEDFWNNGQVKFISQHAYPGGNGKKINNAADERRNMLSPKWVSSYEKFHDSFVAGDNVLYRIEEVNSFYNGGAIDVSNTFASALWGLDFMCWWSQHDAMGINFHTGDSVAAGEDSGPCMYASFVTAEDGYYIRPLGYALKMFDLIEGDKWTPLVITNKDSLNITTYAFQSTGELFVVIINKELEAVNNECSILVSVDSSYSNGKIISLTAPDASAKDGIRLGGESISNTGTWNGEWKELDSTSAGNYDIDIPHASACLIKLSVE